MKRYIYNNQISILDRIQDYGDDLRYPSIVSLCTESAPASTAIVIRVVWLRLSPDFFGQRQQFLSVFKTIKETFGNALNPHLCANQGASQHRA